MFLIILLLKVVLAFYKKLNFHFSRCKHVSVRPSNSMFRKIITRRHIIKRPSLRLLSCFCILVIFFLKFSRTNDPSEGSDDCLTISQLSSVHNIDFSIDFSTNINYVSISLHAISKMRKHQNSLFLIFLLIAGDIESNPGPIKNPCSICLKSVAKNHRAVLCDNCNLWSHIKCSNISGMECNHLSNLEEFNFQCPRCLMNELPSPDIDIHSSRSNDINPNIGNNVEFNTLASAKGLKMGHLNINGLLNKIDEVRILVNLLKLDIFAVSETKLDDNILDHEIMINGFKLFRLDRDRHGGGVLIYCRDNISSFSLTKLNNKEFESLWIKIKLKNTKPIFVSVIEMLSFSISEKSY